ncbi:MAG TPA: amidohydrolase family protein [Candidatus Thermoplasmatota archaeon]|nr:amidohydrolase family protein [Candidatus Thermoplasmatota archaeon]
MPLFAGNVLLRHEAVPGWLEAEGGQAVAWGEGEPPSRPDAVGWIVPAPVNAHTHVADAFLRGVPGKPRTVAELVGPGGWKHQRLREAAPEAVAAGIRGYVGEMASIGTAAFLDFREGGVAGARLLRGLAAELGAKPFILGRPEGDGFRPEEAEALLAAADGLGLSARRDFGHPQDLEAWVEAAHARRKAVALHASEAKHEPIGPILALEPDFLVHCTQAGRRDLEDIAGAGVPVVVCPRSNLHFGLKTPLLRMREAGLTLAVGTDNGMLQDGNLLAELALLRRLDPTASLEELLRMATWNGRALARLPPAWPPRRGAPLDLVVLPKDPLPAAADFRPGFTGLVESP